MSYRPGVLPCSVIPWRRCWAIACTDMGQRRPQWWGSGPGRGRVELIVTLDEDRAEVERVAVSWQGVPELEQEAMLTRLGRMLEYLDSTEDAEFQLRTDVQRLMRTIEAGLGR